MLFTTFSFTIFFLIVLSLWWTLVSKNNKKIRQIFLIIVSYIFYAFTGPQWMLSLLFTSLFTYITTKSMEKRPNKAKKIALFSIFILIGQLVFWKYVPWTILTWNTFDIVLKNNQYYINPPEWAFPIGLSFFTFHALSLIIPVWKEEEKSLSLLGTLAHISFFPCLLAGPVLRKKDIDPRWDKEWKWKDIEWTAAISRFMLGMTFKWVFASQAALWADQTFQGMSDNGFEVLLGIHAYALQIFFDFAGYSHMAIAIAMLLGWKLPENFTQPYLALSLQDFWRKWHRSLSFFFRDNVYIHMLGGNRKGTASTLFNGFFTMLLSGLWHGANITFILWGAWHGIMLCIQSIFRKIFSFSIPKIISWFLTIEIVVFGWVMFRATDLQNMKDIYTQILNWNNFEFFNIFSEVNINTIYWSIVMLSIIFFEKRLLDFFDKINEKVEVANKSSYLITIAGMIILSIWSLMIMYFGPVGVPAFIYNGF